MVIWSSVAHCLLQLVSRTVVACIGAASLSWSLVTPLSTVCLILKQPLLTTPQLSAQGGQNIWKYLQKFYRLNCSQQPDLVSSAVEKSGHITRMPPVIVTPHTSAPAATAGAIMGNWTDKTGAVLSWLLPTAVAGQLKIMQKWVVRVCPRPRCKL